MNRLHLPIALLSLLLAATLDAQDPPLPPPAEPVRPEASVQHEASVQPEAPAQPTAPVQPAVALALALEGPVAMVFHTIKADQGAQFEQLFERLRTGLTASQTEARRQQIAGWRLLKQNAFTAEGHQIYISVIDPVVAGQEYDMARLLAEVYPDEGAALYQVLLGSHVEPTVQASSLTAVTGVTAPAGQP